MQNLFDEKDAREFFAKYPGVPEELSLRVYTSRLIGRDPNLVLHGGGNTSVKIRMKNLFGEKQEILYVKGSGFDLATIEPSGFVGLDLGPLRRFREIENLSDEEMENQLQTHKVIASSPNPSVEALLHAFLPHKYVDHTHADSILVLTNQKNGEYLIREALGPKVAVLPYAMSGLPLARRVIEAQERGREIEAIVILNHGIFTFDEDVRRSYERMVGYVGKAESFIEKKIKGKALITPRLDLTRPGNLVLSTARFAQIVRGACSHQTMNGRRSRFYTEVRSGDELVKISLSKDARGLCDSGVLTPDHVTRTKNIAVYIEAIPEDDGDLQRVVKEIGRCLREKV